MLIHLADCNVVNWQTINSIVIFRAQLTGIILLFMLREGGNLKSEIIQLYLLLVQRRYTVKINKSGINLFK